MAGYAQSTDVIGALRGPDDIFGGARAGRRADLALGATSLIAILAGCLVLVLAAADRPSLLAATTTSHYFPRWMAGPLGGLWPALTRSTQALRYLFSGAIVLMYASYLLGLRFASRLPARWIILAILAAHAIMFLAPPLALTDIFNYVNYGRMEIVHGLNPYTTTPILEPHTDPAFALSNWHQLLSPYGPLFTLITFAVVPLGVAGSFWALKALLMLTSLAIVWLVWRSAHILQRRAGATAQERRSAAADPRVAIVLVGLNPIVLVWGLGGDHNDFLMMFLVTLGFYLLLRAGAFALPVPRVSAAGASGRGPETTAGTGEPLGEARTRALAAGAGAAFVTAVAIKASAGILLPVVLAGLARDRRLLWNTLLGIALAAIVLALASVSAFGAHFPDLSTQGRLVTMTSIPNLLGLLLGAGGETTTLRLLLSGVLVAAVAWCAMLAYRRRDAIAPSGWASVALLVTLAWVLPWYALWLLPLSALSSSRRLRSATLLFGVYLIVAWAPITGTVFNAIGFHPEKTSLGRLHQRYVKELLY